MLNITYKSDNNRKCWVAYFDLLGTKALIDTGNIQNVFSAYQKAISKLDEWKTRHPAIFKAWFSDTFILYSSDDSQESFEAIELICRWFVFSLLKTKIPVRGSISIGSFYADPDNAIYLGEALVDAYQWGENQNWIGFILTPSATNRFNELDCNPLIRSNYQIYDVPLKVPRKALVAACVLGNWALLSGFKNPLLEPLKQMQKKVKCDQVLKKYEQTVTFLEKYQSLNSDNTYYLEGRE